MMHPKVSFVIPVRGDAARLRDSLHAIADSGLAPSDIEIVVIDNGANGASVDAAQEAGARVIRIPHLGVSALRNRGVEVSTAELVAFCDADNVVAPGWSVVAYELLDDADVGAVGALCVPPTPSTWVQRAYDGLRDHTPGTRPTRWLGAGNMAVRRSAFRQVGGFDESLVTCEDADLCKRLRAAGWTLLSDSRLRNVHLGDPENLRQLFLGELWRGRDSLRTALRSPVAPGDIPGVAVAFINLGLIAAAGCGLLATPFGGWLVSGIAVLAFFGIEGLRTGLMIRRQNAARLRHVHEVFAVACTYDLARSLALVWRSGYHRERDA